MECNVSLEEIPDGKRYEGNDLVKADYGDCEGCSACYQGMGSPILLDPYDTKRMEEGLCMDFNQLMTSHIEPNVVDYVILPNLKTTGSGERCSFLDGRGRCSIRPYCPGFCRLFPPGRICKDRSFRYFLQIHGCPRENRARVKARKWVDTLDLKSYERFVVDWYCLFRDLGERLKESGNQETIEAANMYAPNQFYATPHKVGEDFYPQLYRWLEAAATIATV